MLSDASRDKIVQKCALALPPIVIFFNLLLAQVSPFNEKQTILLCAVLTAALIFETYSYLVKSEVRKAKKLVGLLSGAASVKRAAESTPTLL